MKTEMRECNGCELIFDFDDLIATGGSKIYCDTCYAEQEEQSKGLCNF